MRGGYEQRELWEYPFDHDGQTLSWEDAMALLTDETGRPGPSTWEAGDYPEGSGDYPVGGVSWYEAAAYARFIDQELPTVHHWRWAFADWTAAWMLPASNLEGSAPAPVGQFHAPSWPGTLDMAGNVREWCFNEIEGGRAILGGGWNDPYFVGMSPSYAQPPLDRSETNGFRLVITDDDAALAERLRRPLPERAIPDPARHAPVSDDVFEAYRSLYAYDPAPLNEEVESTELARNWVRQRVSFDAAYGGERMILYLYLPRNASPPYQTVLYFPGGIAFGGLNSIDQYRHIHLDFIVKAGRAVAFPVYKGSFERGIEDAPGIFGGEATSQAIRDRVIQLVNDFRRTIDYLETREDIDQARLGYYGYSAGAAIAPLILALESRMRAAVVYVAGLVASPRPETAPSIFLPRVDVPLRMFSGELDHSVPLETRAKPFFDLLGTEHKDHVIAPGGHFVPRHVLIRGTLDWLDEYLGPVN